VTSEKWLSISLRMLGGDYFQYLLNVDKWCRRHPKEGPMGLFSYVDYKKLKRRQRCQMKNRSRKAK
jgi:hypothetical protein